MHSNTTVLSIWKEHFSGFFCKFLSEKVETIFWERENEPSRWFKFNDGCWKFFRKWFWRDPEIKNECSEHLEIELFSFLWVTKFKPFSGKVRQSFQNCLNQSLIMGSFFRKWFWGYLELKNECSERLKRVFFSFLQILSDNVETVFWEWESEPSKTFKFKIGKRQLFRKCFGSALEIKNEGFERLKRAFFSFFQIVEWPGWNRFLGKQDIAFKTI